jgi:SAM-dependent methyltransferase
MTESKFSFPVESCEQSLYRDEVIKNASANMQTLDDFLRFIVSPDSGLPISQVPGSEILVDSQGNSYPLRGKDRLPLLIPVRLQRHYTDRLRIGDKDVVDAYLQYFYLSQVKQAGVVSEINAPAEDVHYQRHLFRMKQFLATAQGLVLDVGCDDPDIGRGLLPVGGKYVGLDPFCTRASPFRIIGFGENLPFCDASFNAVVFNTSLDHILDWRRALKEACRVLIPGGELYLSTLIWTDRADLVTDAVHFHHFRDYEIFGALKGCGLFPTSERRYDYKGATHRHGLYVSARKLAQ